ncbi:hypothetical protein GCM10007079_04640 [Nocardiopsis terrae]|uniref:DUF2795 domain-containing protein n=1 Tax=Nocardiopsis terrae TaxID=372655 RepID=A0ABR9HNB1_9ACTN|nr:DUF2795 domain-containing protein [Nocardiopsis terrae]MBE1460518.1 hypothetical protein [Nocardiopsis terrae]GHC71855.1 hypothetical protein GCM10007079_04640 [Nocardiopsis terrae]
MGVKRGRSGLRQVLAGMDFPQPRDAVVTAALEAGADEEIVSALRSIPDAEYNEANEILGSVPLPEYEPGSHTESAQAQERDQ